MFILDTLTLSKRFTNAGLTPEQADVLTETFREAQEQGIENLASKEDINHLKSDISNSETRIQSKIDQLEIKQSGELKLVKWMLAIVIAATVIPAIKDLFL